MSTRLTALRLALTALAASSSTAALATTASEQTFPATLAGHVVLPALTLTPAPADAPADARVSGKFNSGARVTEVGSVPADTGATHGRRATGVSLPLDGQPVQGFSGFAMEPGEGGAFWMNTDNGFGNRANSPDALLMVHRMTPDWQAGTMALETVFLRDPDMRVPFRIAYEGSDSRHLTGADFDLEAVQLVNGDLWFGDEFGPYLIQAGTDGVVKAVHPTLLDGVELRSPDTPGISALSVVGRDWQVPRSGGYEGLALQPGTGLLWAMLERPLLTEANEPEGQFLRVMAFNPAAGEWTGQQFRFALSEGAVAIGDFNFIDETRALVIERDGGEGDPSLACAGDPAPDCFPVPAVHKRVVLIDTATLDAEGFVRRIGHIDLMNIADPQGLNRLETVANRDLTGIMTFPFITVESVMAVSDTQIIVGNDNNMPFATGRRLDAPADNEVILLDVPELLQAR